MTLEHHVLESRSEVLKEQEVPLYDPAKYESKRIHATSRDGELWFVIFFEVLQLNVVHSMMQCIVEILRSQLFPPSFPLSSFIINTYLLFISLPGRLIPISLVYSKEFLSSQKKEGQGGTDSSVMPIPSSPMPLLLYGYVRTVIAQYTLHSIGQYSTVLQYSMLQYVTIYCRKATCNVV